MENQRRPLFPILTKRLVMPFAVGMLLCSTNMSAADVLANSVSTVAQNPQKSQVSGRVVDATGEVLIGVNIVEKGNKTNGTVTDGQGRFVLNVAPNAQLVVSYVGYKQKEVSVSGKTALDVTL